jgi:hypothetical protein
MTELLSVAAPLEDDQHISTGELNAMFDAQNPEIADREENREVSPTGSSLLRAAGRVNSFLEKRVINKAHSEALVMNEDHDAEVAMTNAHEEAIGMNDAESVAAYDRSFDAAIIENRDRDHEEALPMNKAFDKTERRDARAERLDEAKDRVRKLGRASWRKSKDAGLLVAGGALLASEATANAARSGAETVALGAMEAKDKASSVIETGALKTLYGIDKVQGIAASGKERVSDTTSAAKEALAYRKEAAARRKEEALTRKYARHAKWMNMKAAAKSRGQELIDRGKNTIDETRLNYRRTRSAGRMALQTFRDHRNFKG